MKTNNQVFVTRYSENEVRQAHVGKNRIIDPKYRTADRVNFAFPQCFI